ncbi:MAG TPA: HAD family hydrolase [Acidobacteriota bacterium]|nr:HAD family hydrolase [Acidobacteriota bacterium]
MNRAVFLDRDGTVSEEVGYVNHIDRFRVYPWTTQAIRKLNGAGLQVIIITNQAGVARGYFPECLVHETHQELKRQLALGGAVLDAIYFCPHHPEGTVRPYRIHCSCRKPETGLIEQAAQERHLDLSKSFVVGDRYQDLRMGFKVNARTILVLSGYGQGELLYQKETWPRQPDHIAANLLDAVDWILSCPDRMSP